jgi:hypothetical protein
MYRGAALALVLIVLAAGTPPAFAASELELAPRAGSIVATRWVGRPFLSPFEVDLRLAVRNASSTTAAAGVVGRVTASRAPAAIVDGVATFGTVGPGATVPSTDTVTLRISSPLDVFRLGTSLQVAFTYAVGNQPPTARVTAGAPVYVASPVAVDGSTSSDPEGTTLTFEWTLAGRPTGSAATLTGTGPLISLIPDVPGVYSVRLTVSDGQASSSPATVTLQATSRPVLQGVATDLATAFITDLDLGPVTPADVDPASNVILSRLLVMLDASATVGQVNAAAAAVGATLAYTRRGSTLLTLSVPRQPTVQALHAIAATLEAQPGIVMATHDAVASVDVLPTTPDGKPVDSSTLKHLLSTRFPAAWNAGRLAAGCTPAGQTAIVHDGFAPIAPFGLATQLPSFVPVVLGSSIRNDQHGYDVAMVLAAEHDGVVPTGAHAAGECLRLEGISWGLLGAYQLIDQLVQRLSALSENTVVNLSYGFGAPAVCGAATSTTCTSFDLAAAPAGQIRNYVEAQVLKTLYWATHGLNDVVSARALFTVAAGNDLGTSVADVYPGFADARFHNAVIAMRTLPNAAREYTRDDLWGGGGAAADARLSVAQATAVQSQFAALNKLSLLVQLTDHSLSVGATVPSLLPMPAVFSNLGPDVWAVGQNIPRSDGRTITGTSFAAPTVAGLASYLWTLSPELRAADVSRTTNLIRQNARSVGGILLIDAYATALAIDRPGAMPVRRAILDLTKDDRFDDLDVQRYLEAFAATSRPDFGREDLNGDGMVGGGFTTAMDLDAANYDGERGVLERITLSIEGVSVKFDEERVTDLQALCYLAYSALYAPDRTDERRALLAERCTPRLQATGGVYRSALAPGTLGTALLIRLRGVDNAPPTAPVTVSVVGPAGWAGGAVQRVTYPAGASRSWFVFDAPLVAGLYTVTAGLDGETLSFDFDVDGSRSLAPPTGLTARAASSSEAQGSWASVSGAASYLARVVDSTGGTPVTVPPARFTMDTRATLGDLPLQLGRDYRYQVWALSTSLQTRESALPPRFDVSFNRVPFQLDMQISPAPVQAEPGASITLTANYSSRVTNRQTSWSATAGAIVVTGPNTARWTAPSQPFSGRITATNAADPGIADSVGAAVNEILCGGVSAKESWEGEWIVTPEPEPTNGWALFYDPQFAGGACLREPLRTFFEKGGRVRITGFDVTILEPAGISWESARSPFNFIGPNDTNYSCASVTIRGQPVIMLNHPDSGAGNLFGATRRVEGDEVITRAIFRLGDARVNRSCEWPVRMTRP